MTAQIIAVPLAKSQAAQAADTLARAFLDDPFFTYALPDSDRRLQVLIWFYKRFVRYALRHGRIHTTPSLDGIAIWFGPRKTDLDWLGVLQTGLFLVPLKLSSQEFRRTMELQNCADRLHAKLATGPHWYLSELGVEPSRQRQGVGHALLQPMLAQADHDLLPCYLETNKEKNVRFYEANGFQIAGLEQATPQAPHTWAMLRNPEQHASDPQIVEM